MENSKRKLAAILFTDLVGYSAISNRDERLALELLQEHRGLLRPMFSEHGGREVKTTGDGFLIEFESALDAVNCAVRIQERLAVRNTTETHGRRIMVRIGIHVGDVVVTRDDVFGDGVNIAARLQQFADPGAICVSQQVLDQVHNKVDFPIASVRHGELKNISSTIRIYQIKPGEWAPAPASTRLRGKLKSTVRTLRRLAGTRRAASVAGAFSAAILLTLLSRPAPVEQRPGRQAAALAVPESRIAVLPFHATGLSKDEEYIADAMTEELILALSKVPGARVIARSTIAAYKDTRKTPAQVAAELNVGTIIEGSVRKAADRLKVTVTLVDPRSEMTFWSTEQDDRLRNVFDLQSKLAKSVSSKLKMRQLASLPNGATVLHVPDHEAFLHFLKGRYFANLRTPDSIAKGVALFKKAIDIDPNFAGPYVSLASSYGLMAYYEYVSPREALTKGMYYADKALALEPDSADALSAIALRKLFYDHDWATADAYFNRAIELRPGYSGVHYLYSDFLIAHGRIPESRKEIALALELDPLSLNVQTAAGRPDFYARNYDAAIKRYSSVIEMDPNFMPALLWMGRAYMAKGDYAKALESLRRAGTVAPDSVMVRSSIGRALALSGKHAEARKLRAELEAQAKSRYIPPYDVAAIDIALGERSRALEHLEAAYEERSYHIVYARIDPAFDALVEEPRFQALIRHVTSPAH